MIVEAVESVLSGETLTEDFEYLFEITASGGDPTNYC